MSAHPPEARRQAVRQERWQLLEHLDAITNKPLIALSFAWIALIILQFTRGLGPFLQAVGNAIWIIFILDFLLELAIAPHKWQYLRGHWLTAISLVLPAFRAVRIVQAFRLLRAARVAPTVGLLRIVTGINRGMGALRGALGRRGVGYVVALTALVVFVGAAGMAQFESPDALRQAGMADAAGQGAGLHSYGEAVWWTGMIMTTMGSDYWPKTAAGRLLCLLLALYAFAIFGYITATLSSFFVGRDVEAERGQEEAAMQDGAEAATLRAEIAALRGQMAALAAHLEESAVGRVGGDEE